MDIRDFLILFLVIFVLIYFYFEKKFNYWENKHLNTPERPIILFGNFKNVFLARTTFSEFFLQLYRTAKSQNLKHCGIFIGTKPAYVPIDRETIGNILRNDFTNFMNHGVQFNEKVEPIQAHLFNLENHRWRTMREKLSPVFTSGKLKTLFETILNCANSLSDSLNDLERLGQPIEINNVFGNFTTDVIVSCAFGFECNSFKNPEMPFRKYGQRVFKKSNSQNLINFLKSLVPGIQSLLPNRILSSDIEEFFTDLIKDIVNHRENSKVYRNDFIQLLIQLKNNKKEGITMQELIAQAFVFFAAGFETSSTTMSFALYELAKNVGIQKKLREEISAVLKENNNKITYDSIAEMGYLDRVVKETLRKFPPLSILPRICTKEYVVPNTKVLIEKGTRVFVPIWGIHMDPEYHPDPEKFDPERFNDENKRIRPSCTWLPFGEGPRICIGLRFGLLQTKIGIIEVLRNHKFSLNSKTLISKIESRSGILSANGVWLNVEKI